MNPIREETRQSLQNLISRSKVEFVTTEPRVYDRFKYILGLSFNKYISNGIISLNNTRKKTVNRLKLSTKDINFLAIRNDLTIWLAESFIEGAAINFVVWALFGMEFTPITMLAWGVGMKMILDYYWRLRHNGANTTIPSKN